MNTKLSLLELLNQTGYFQSIHETRILTHLIRNPLKDTVKDICDETGLPDSKVYPALKLLVNLGLILKESNHRPSRYYFTNPRTLEEFMNNNYSKELENKKTGLSLLNQQVINSWNPEEQELGPVAYLYRDNSIFSEILRIMKNTKVKIVLILSENFEPFIDTVITEIPKLISRGIKVELALPQSLTPGLEDYISTSEKLLKFKTSITQENSYIVRDQKTMLSITHRKQESVAMLTDDQLLVEYIDSCWNNSNCCTQINYQIETKDAIDLEILK